MRRAETVDHPVAQQYDRWAAVYDQLWQRYVNQTVPLLEAWARVEPDERVLDVGCGTGAFEERLVKAGAAGDVVGVDLSPNMLRQARAKLAEAPTLAFQQADVHALPFDNDGFDVAVSASTFHYFEDPDQALMEIAHVLRPGGRLVVLDWCQDFWMCRTMDAVLRVADPAYQRCFTLDEVRSFVHRSPLTWARGRRTRVGWVWGMMIIEATLHA